MEKTASAMQDEATKRTASDALFSKISAAKLGYFTDDYSMLFTKKQRKMMPIINRGTWTRVFSVRTLINNFIEKFKDHDNIQIVSLGAGLDSNYFYYAENSTLFNESNVKYIEIDFKDITEQKIEVIKENDQLQKLIFGDVPASYQSDGSLVGPRYKLFPCDIRDTELLGDRMLSFEVDQTAATLVLTE